MRVAIVLTHDSCARYSDGGAIGLIARDLRDASAQGHEIRIFGPPNASAPLVGPGFEAVRPAWWERLRRPKAAYRLALIRQLRQFAPSILEVHNSYGLAVRVGRALPHARLVSVLHSPVELILAERNAWLSSVDAAVCVSNSVRNALIAGVSPSLAERARTIYNPLPAVPAAPSTDRERIVLFAGRIVPDKGPDAFVSAVAMIRDQLPGWRFLLIGSEGRDPTPAARGFADRVRDQAIAAGVEVMGQLSNATVASIMAKAMIVVVPSRYEDPFPRVAQEALACGAVVVSSGRGGLPEATGDAALIADPDDTKALSVAIVTAASDEGLRSDLVERGRRHAQQFAIQAVVRHWQDLRESLLSPERCRRHPAQRPGR